MLDLGTLRLGIKVDSDAAKSELNKVGGEATGTGSKVEALASKAKMMVKAFVAAAAVKELAKIGKAALEAYSQYEQLEGGVQKLFGEEGSQYIMKYADRAYKTAGISANQYMEQATSFSASLISSLNGDTVKAAKVTDMAIQDMSDNANVFGSDMASIQNAYQGFAKQNYTMLDNLKLGYGGTKEEMQRLLSDAEKLSGQKYDISNLSDVYEAIHVVQQEMNITGTTSREAASTIEGSTNMMKASWQNLLTSMGKGKGVEKATTELINSFGTMAKNIAPVALRIMQSLVVALVNAVPKVISGIGTVMSKLAEALDKDGKGKMGTAAVKLITNLVKGLIKAIPQLLKGALQLTVALVGALIKNAASFVKAGTEAMSKFIKGFMESHPKIASAVKTIGQVFNVVLTPVKALIDLVRSAWKALMGEPGNKKFSVSAPFGGAISMIKEVFSKWKTVLGQKAKKVYEVAKKGLSSAISNIKDVYNSWKDVLHQTAKKTFEVAKKGFSSVLDGMKSIYNKWKDILSQASSKTFTVNNVTSNSSGGGKKKKKSRIGLREVPYDGYEAELHKGEVVLTAAETNQYKALLNKAGEGKTVNGGDISINVYGTSNMNVQELAAEIERRLIQAQKTRRLAWQ